eukprot:comp20066_c0_seq1/m.39400 comp20066_c0_seq1/g.39400  ORF comp20066_c0_seq1/g.39400 comp20066_c0_seq1/m.39400 type:complete len:392 (+) comp20066_c0_seq1:3-1178(+)
MVLQGVHFVTALHAARQVRLFTRLTSNYQRRFRERTLMSAVCDAARLDPSEKATALLSEALGVDNYRRKGWLRTLGEYVLDKAQRDAATASSPPVEFTASEKQSMILTATLDFIKLISRRTPGLRALAASNSAVYTSKLVEVRVHATPEEFEVTVQNVSNEVLILRNIEHTWFFLERGTDTTDRPATVRSVRPGHHTSFRLRTHMRDDSYNTRIAFVFQCSVIGASGTSEDITMPAVAEHTATGRKKDKSSSLPTVNAAEGTDAINSGAAAGGSGDQAASASSSSSSAQSSSQAADGAAHHRSRSSVPRTSRSRSASASSEPRSQSRSPNFMRSVSAERTPAQRHRRSAATSDSSSSTSTSANRRSATSAAATSAPGPSAAAEPSGIPAKP